jgi:hypothetical protein
MYRHIYIDTFIEYSLKVGISPSPVVMPAEVLECVGYSVSL